MWHRNTMLAPKRSPSGSMGVMYRCDSRSRDRRKVTAYAISYLNNFRGNFSSAALKGRKDERRHEQGNIFDVLVLSLEAAVSILGTRWAPLQHQPLRDVPCSLICRFCCRQAICRSLMASELDLAVFSGSSRVVLLSSVAPSRALAPAAIMKKKRASKMRAMVLEFIVGRFLRCLSKVLIYEPY